ncbi:MAG: chromate transporter [Betaproteobacteria bacterium]|nr:chromate transporter [Betaproteobacteria bacterium]
MSKWSVCGDAGLFSALPTKAESKPRSAAHLFWVFSQLALSGFGGVLPIAEDRLVRREGWVSAQDFLETLALAQVLPGPNICNMAVMLGDRFHGTRGALAALSGLLLPPLVPVLLCAFVYSTWADSPIVAGALRAMAMAAAGLILAMSIRLSKGLKHPKSDGLIACLMLAALLVFRLPLLYALGLVGAVSLGLAWRRQDRSKD